MAIGLAVVVVLLVAVAWVSSAVPARLAQVAPADGGSVPTPPAEVALSFSGTFHPKSLFVQVNAADGSSVNAGRAQLDGRRVAVPVTIGGRGSYVVTYRITLDGGRDVSGVTNFTVAPGAPASSTGGAAGQSDGANAQPQADAVHDHGVEGPWNLSLLVVDALLIPGAVVLVVRRPRLRGRAGT
jgi:copper transport protein